MEVCRACMNNSLNMVDIFSEQPLPNNESSLADMVNKLVDFKVIYDDPFPQKMCESCCINVQIAFRFKLKFEQCFQLLSLPIKQIKLEPLEIKIEVDSTRQNVQEILSPTTTNFCSFKPTSCVSQAKLTSDVEVDFKISSNRVIDGPIKNASSLSERFSFYNMQGDSSSMLMQNEMNKDLEQDNSSLHSKKVRSRARLKHTGERPFKCELCSKTFKFKNNFNAHMKSHTGERFFKCAQCEKGFAKKAYLNAHILTHTSERPFKCSYCDKGFIQQAFLKMHIRTHTGERPYECEDCQAKFRQLHHLHEHKRLHTGERPFKCSHCDKTFVLKSNLKIHIRIHTGELPYKCEECLAKYTQWNNLDEKERNPKDKPTFKMAFSERRQLLKHIKTVHEVEQVLG